MTPSTFAAFTHRRGVPLVWRVVTGAGPAQNPPSITGAVTVSAAALVGASALSLRATYAVGRLLDGDKIAVGAVEHTVTAPAQASGHQFAIVAITPPLAAAVASGAVVTLSFGADTPVIAAVSDYADTERPAGWVSGDMKAIIPALGMPVTPHVGHLALFDGKAMRAETIKPRRWAGVLLGWEVQVRK